MMKAPIHRDDSPLIHSLTHNLLRQERLAMIKPSYPMQSSTAEEQGNITPINRRTFLLMASIGALLTVFPGCAPRLGISDREKEALLRMARLLYPHDALANDVYREVMGPFQEMALADPKLADVLRSGLEALNEAAGGDWNSSPRAAQIEALKRIEAGEFFQTVKGNVSARLYDHPKVWELIGYGGPSADKGGYLLRGFDDIDWLPED